LYALKSLSLYVSSCLPGADSETQRFPVTENEHCKHHAGV